MTTCLSSSCLLIIAFMEASLASSFSLCARSFLCIFVFSFTVASWVEITSLHSNSRNCSLSYSTARFLTLYLRSSSKSAIRASFSRLASFSIHGSSDDEGGVATFIFSSDLPSGVDTAESTLQRSLSCFANTPAMGAVLGMIRLFVIRFRAKLLRRDCWALEVPVSGLEILVGVCASPSASVSRVRPNPIEVKVSPSKASPPCAAGAEADGSAGSLRPGIFGR